MQARDAVESFGERVARVQDQLEEMSYAEITEILAYILGSIVAEADPAHTKELRRLIFRRILRAEQVHRTTGGGRPWRCLH